MMDCCPNCGATELHMQYFDEVSIIYRCALCNASFDQHEVVYCEDKGDYETLGDEDGATGVDGINDRGIAGDDYSDFGTVYVPGGVGDIPF